MIQSPVAETPNQKQILKGTKQENKANILGGKNLNKDDNSKDGEFANILKNIKGIKKNLEQHIDLAELKLAKVDLDSGVDVLNPIIAIDIKDLTIAQINNAKQNLEGLLKEIKSIAGFKDIKNIGDLVEYANQKGLNIQKLDLKILKNSLIKPKVVSNIDTKKSDKNDTKKVIAEDKQIKISLKEPNKLSKIAINNKIEQKTVDTNSKNHVKSQNTGLESVIKEIKEHKNIQSEKIVQDSDDEFFSGKDTLKDGLKETASIVKTQIKLDNKKIEIIDTKSKKLDTQDINSVNSEELVKKQTKQINIKSEKLVDESIQATQDIVNQSAQNKTQKPNIIVQQLEDIETSIVPKNSLSKTQNSTKTQKNDSRVLSKDVQTKSAPLETLLSEIQISKTVQSKESDFAQDIEQASQEYIDTNIEKNDTIVKKDDMVFKTKQARQSVRNFAQELKEKFDNYKPPIMKLSIDLKPVNLGKINVTLLSRGESVKININSTQSSMNLIMQNIGEFKNALTQAGLNNIDMNFSSSQNGTGNQKSGQEQEGQNKTEYSYESIEEDEELLSVVDDIELVIPRYT